jgi:peptidoglycan/LPS O-acetylase OafA/YrhL
LEGTPANATVTPRHRKIVHDGAATNAFRVEAFLDAHGQAAPAEADPPGIQVPARAEERAATVRRLPQHPGLDGVRGAAVAGVLFFHGGFAWAQGGYLGVSTFFTLSGFLITGLLVHERAARGAIDLGRFWSRRFRRLMPALLTTLLGIALYAALLSDSDQLGRVRIDALATLGYVANWRFLLSGQRYEDLFAAPSPVLHAWSLGVEEQFYLFFPLLVAGVLALTPGRRRGLVMVLGGLVAGSVALSLHFHNDHNRVYYGTDTRIAEILLGAFLAIWVAGPGADLAVRRRPTLAVGGLAAGGATLLAWSALAQTNSCLYVGGLAAYGLLSTLLVAAAVAPGPMRNVFRFAPLRWLGLISYGVYLYHWPIFLWLSPERTGLSLAPLFAVRLSVTIPIAVASYHLIEQPIRHGALPGWRALGAALVAVTVTAFALVVATVTPGPPSRLVPEPTTSGQGTSPPKTLLFGGLARTVTAADPLRVLIVGDSVSYDAEPGVLAIFQASGAAAATAVNALGFGLTLGPYDWRHEWARLVAERRPEVVVMFLGGWDEAFMAKEGADAYGHILDEAVAVLTAGGAKLLLVGMPITVNRAGIPYPRIVPNAFRAAAARHQPTVGFLDLDPVVSPGGRYMAYLDGPAGRERVRKMDGTHLCPSGSARIGRAIFDAVAASWALPAPPAEWRAGDWALNPRFDDPHGACPK